MDIVYQWTKKQRNWKDQWRMQRDKLQGTLDSMLKGICNSDLGFYNKRIQNYCKLVWANVEDLVRKEPCWSYSYPWTEENTEEFSKVLSERERKEEIEEKTEVREKYFRGRGSWGFVHFLLRITRQAKWVVPLCQIFDVNSDCWLTAEILTKRFRPRASPIATLNWF